MKNLLRRGILYGTALAALAGCSIDNSRVINPEVKGETRTVEEASNTIRSRTDNPELEQRVNNALGMVSSMNRNAGKPTQAEIQHFSYEEFTGDINLNHYVDFDDFFLLVDEFGNLYDFDHFFKLADNFGKRVNSMPRVTGLESSNGNEANVDDEVVFSGVAEDKENDRLDFLWLVENEPTEINGSVLRKIFNEAGEYHIALRVSDSFGAQSDELSRMLNVVYSGPVLSLPNEISFPQWISGQTTGNVYRLNLDDYVEDPNFSDSEMNWNFEVENNEFEHNKENTAPYGQYMEFLLDSYRTEALSLIVNGGLLTIDPVGNYNSNDHGERYVNLTATNPNSASANKRIKINVKRSAEFDDYYDDVLKGVGWKPEKAYIWVGPSRDSREPRDPRLWTGPRLTDAQRKDFERVIEQWPEQTDYNTPLEIIYVDVDNYQKIYNESFENYNGSRGRIMTSDNSFIFYRDDNATPASADYSLAYDSNGRVRYNFMAIKGRNSATLANIAHEELCHGGPFDHSSNRSLDSRDSSVCHYANTRETTKPRHKAAFDSFYEVFENRNTVFKYSDDLSL